MLPSWSLDLCSLFGNAQKLWVGRLSWDWEWEAVCWKEGLLLETQEILNSKKESVQIIYLFIFSPHYNQLWLWTLYYEAGVNLVASQQVVSSNLGVFLWVSSLSSGFLQKAKDMQVSLIGDS